MTIKDLQDLTAAWDCKHPVPGDSAAAILRRLGGCVDRMAAHAGAGGPADGMRRDAADLLWETARLAGMLGIDLTEAVIANLEIRDR